MVSSAIRITQHHDLRGAPAPAQYLKPLESTLTLPAHSVAINALVKLGARRTGPPGEFVYLDPNAGSGVAVIEGLQPGEVERIDDYFRVEEMRTYLGLGHASRQWIDTKTVPRQSKPSRNPIGMIISGSVLIVFCTVMGFLSSIGPLRVPGEAVTWVYLPMFAVLGALGIVIVVQHSRRLRGWSQLRAAFRARGEQMPYSLRLDN